jgi:hypothetical protein
MDDDLLQLEAELKRLRPIAPSKALVARVRQELAGQSPAPAHFRLHWLWATLLPAAAMVAIVVALFSQKPDLSAGRPKATPDASPTAGGTESTREAPFKPVSAENVLVAASDEGLVTLEDGTPARRERRHYVDTIMWKNPRTNASLTWTVPREEVRVVPIAFH